MCVMYIYVMCPRVIILSLSNTSFLKANIIGNHLEPEMDYPVVFALMVFLIYHFIGTFSKNAAEDGTISATFGSIISTLVIFPLSIYLFRRASQDKEIFNIEFFSSKIVSFFKLKK